MFIAKLAKGPLDWGADVLREHKSELAAVAIILTTLAVETIRPNTQRIISTMNEKFSETIDWSAVWLKGYRNPYLEWFFVKVFDMDEHCNPGYAPFEYTGNWNYYHKVNATEINETVQALINRATNYGWNGWGDGLSHYAFRAYWDLSWENRSLTATYRICRLNPMENPFPWTLKTVELLFWNSLDYFLPGVFIKA